MTGRAPTVCGGCGHDPACGDASINGVRYCHDESCTSATPIGTVHGMTATASCYMNASWDAAADRASAWINGSET